MPPNNSVKRPAMISLIATSPLPILNRSAECSPQISPVLSPVEFAAPVPIMDKGQDELPSLPIPPLEQTLDRYLESVRPLITDLEYEHTVALVKAFQEESSDRADGQGKEREQ
ncbi:hypothetical protein BGZ65_001485, partial [Modicella reniformis]